MNSQNQPLVTIGIPLYNEEKYIEEAIRSAASQCDTVWVSDNASTDGSAAICEKVSREYANVHFVRLPHNMGAIANFKFVLDKAETPFFLWLGGHDALPDGYVRQLMQLLESHPEAVLAYGASHHVDMNGNPAGNCDYSYHAMLADKSPTTRLLGLIRHLYDCSLVHGLFRTETLRDAWNSMGDMVFIGTDHILLGHAAISGPFLYAPQTYLIRRDVHLADTQENQLKRLDLRQVDNKQLTYQELQRRNYALAATAAKGTYVYGIWFRLKARLSLVKRFGPFGETFLTRKLDTFLSLLAGPPSDLPLNLLRTLRNGLAYRVHKFQRELNERMEAFQMAKAIRRMRNNLKIIVGASATKQEGWISTEYPLLDLTDAHSFAALFDPGSVSNFLAEHVCEHLSLEDGAKACRYCFVYLRQGGLLRIAVPEGLHPDPDYIAQVRPGGYGAGADDHKVLYDYRTLSALLENAGYKVRLLEWFDEQGKFHHVDWDVEEGFVERSTRFDQRNRVNPTAYTSLIIDAVKP